MLVSCFSVDEYIKVSGKLALEVPQLQSDYKQFDSIDVNKNGIIEYSEWHVREERTFASELNMHLCVYSVSLISRTCSSATLLLQRSSVRLPPRYLA